MDTPFLSNEQKDFIDSLLDIPFDTFKRQIKVVTGGDTIVVSTNANYNSGYKNKNTDVVETTVETVLDAVVEYSPTITDQLLKQNPDIKAKEQQGIVRISVKADGAALLKKAKDIQFDGYSYNISTGDVVRAMFANITYFDFWLVRRD